MHAVSATYGHTLRIRTLCRTRSPSVARDTTAPTSSRSRMIMSELVG